MSHNMPKPDAALKEFFKDNENFAAVFNGYFFNSEPVIKANELEPDDTAYSSIVQTRLGSAKFQFETIDLFRIILYM